MHPGQLPYPLITPTSTTDQYYTLNYCDELCEEAVTQRADFIEWDLKDTKKKNVCDKNLNVTKTLTLKHEAHTGKCLKKDKQKSNIRQDVCNRKKMSPKQYTHTQMKCLRPAGQNKGKDEH